MSLRLSPGAVFADDYEIVAPLAEGGMGSVYVARQRSTGKERALKVLLPQFVSDERTRERFMREARAGSQVDSEHVVEVVAAGIDAATGVPWLAMELLRGEDLESFADRVGPLPAAQVLEICRQLCHGLGAAHAAGLVHRDLKPENVFLAAARRVGVPFTVKILDFGIAKVVHERREVTDAVGTPTWMAPEQTEAGRPVNASADVWALGLLTFRLLAGMPYWKSANETDVNAMSILREVVFEPMEPASVRARTLGSAARLGSDFDGWFARCLMRDPAMRIGNASEALVALEPVLLAMQAAAGAELMPLPLEQAPATVPGTPFTAELINTFRTPELPATRVGPFSKPVQPAQLGAQSVPPSEDVDQYEKRLSRGKLWVWATAIFVAAVAAVAVWQIRERTAGPAPFTGVEREPNNRAPEANLVPYGEKVRGQIGQRLDANRSDRDFFRFTFPQNAHAQLTFKALPNIAPCLFLYRVGADDAFARYCAGQPDRDLLVPNLRLEGGDYYIAVMQDREQYTDAPAPPVLENVSDGYELSVAPADPVEDFEVEPNDRREQATVMKPGSTLRGKLAWMRDVDVVCVSGNAPIRFIVEDGTMRPRGAVLEVTPAEGPQDGIATRVHHAAAKGDTSEHDVKSPYRGPKLTKLDSGACVSLTLTRDAWAPAPLPRVAPAGDQEYVVRAEPL